MSPKILLYSYGYIGVLQSIFCFSTGTVEDADENMWQRKCRFSAQLVLGWLMYFSATPDIGALVRAQDALKDYTDEEGVARVVSALRVNSTHLISGSKEKVLEKRGMQPACTWLEFPWAAGSQKHDVILCPQILSLRTVYYWTLVLGQVAAALASTTKRQPLFGEGRS